MKKIIFHIDVNNAFLSWEAVGRLNKGNKVDIRLIASVIGGDEKLRRGIVLAKSEIAKKYGIITAETLYSARMKCPNLKVFPPNYELYNCESNKLYNLLLNYSPTIHQYSIDECFLDYTGMEGIFGDHEIFANKLQAEIYNKFGWTVNIGIANNIICAKMASDFSKPNKIHTLYEFEIADKLWPLDISDLFMVGKKTVVKLREMGINKVYDLAHYDKNKLIKIFHKQGAIMYDYAWGIGDNSLENMQKEAENRSISTTTTLPEDTNDITVIKKIMFKLCNDIAFRLRQENLYALSIGIILKDYKFKTVSHQEKLKNEINTLEELYKETCKLLDNFYQNQLIRLVGIRVADFVGERKVQLSLFDELRVVEQAEAINKIVDKIQEKYGKDIIKYASNKEF